MYIEVLNGTAGIALSKVLLFAYLFDEIAFHSNDR
jgi:hypothetical protein